MEFNEVIKARKSVRKFKSTKPNWKDIIEAIKSESLIEFGRSAMNALEKYHTAEKINRTPIV